MTKLRHVLVRRFRGIAELDWHVASDLVCLIGPGDAGKTTILEAIALALTPRWNPPIDDADFHGCDPSSPLLIEVTLGDLPRRLLSDSAYGLRLRGYCHSERTLHDEPEGDDEEVITVRLTVDSSLEPRWEVVTDRHPHGHVISARARESLGMAQLGGEQDRDLTWSKGSALSRLTGDSEEHGELLAQAGRNARKTVEPDLLPRMQAAAARAAEAAASFGVSERSGFQPLIDPSASVGRGGLALHDGSVPVRQSGVGTRRLVTLAMQQSARMGDGILLIDEVEYGLDPHRLRQLLRAICSGVESGELAGTVVLATHSPIALGQLRSEHIRVVRAGPQATEVVAPSSDLQGTLITHAEAFLSRRVIVCEGKTELGLILGLDEEWSREEVPMAANGVALADGGGSSKVAKTALEFRRLGYETALIADSDAKLSHTRDELQAAGVSCWIWAGEAATEQRLFLDLPWRAVAELLQLVLDQGIAVMDHLSSKLGRSVSELSEDPTHWPDEEDEAALREALGAAAKSKPGWYKNVGMGVEVGRVVANYLDEAEGTSLHSELVALRQWLQNSQH